MSYNCYIDVIYNIWQQQQTSAVRVWERSIYYWKQEKTKGYGVRATTMEDENAFTRMLCFAQDRCSKHAWSDFKWPERRSRCEWSNCFLWIPFILISGSPNECRLHTCDACIIITWRWKLQATLVPRNKSG